MGAQMRAGPHELNTSMECHLVNELCGPFDERRFSSDELRESSGMFDIPAEVVVAADRSVPQDPRPDVDGQVWRYARRFLHLAAVGGHTIYGSY